MNPSVGGEKKILTFSNLAIVGLFSLGLSITSLYNYLLFHSLAEFFGIFISISIFGIIWNARRFLKNNYFLVLGIVNLFVGLLDVLHTLSYKGMGVFIGFDANLPTQLWISSRYLMAVSLLSAPFFINKRFNFRFYLLAYSLITGGIIFSIFFYPIFPDAYIEGEGLTSFKIVSEYIISVILIAAIILIRSKKAFFNSFVLNAITASISLAVISELLFTLYVDVYGILNLLGHTFKIFASYALYLAIIDIGFNRPYSLLFYDVKQKENQLRQEKEKIETYLDLANSFFIVLDSNERVKLINKIGAKILGYRKEEIIGKNWFDNFLPKKERPKVKKVFEKILKGNVDPVETFENKIITKDGIRVIEWHNSYIKNSKGKIVSIISAGDDITERKQIEERKDEFIKVAGHELRTPVTSIKAFAQLLEKRIKKSADSRNLYFTVMIIAQINRLNQLVADLLDVNRAKEGRLEINKEKINLNNLIKEILDEYKYVNKSHKIEARLSADKELNGDSLRLRQVLSNLLNNAIKYSPEGTKIVVNSEALNGKMYVSVEDSGPGIPDNEQKKIFERFYRVSKQEKKEKLGFGLGLYISSEIVKKHGGEIWVENGKNKGSKFIFSLPAKA